MYDAKRNVGIDLFKVFAMFLVVLLHVFWHGSRDVVDAWNSKAALPGTGTEYSMFFLRAFCCCCVNCFALATGYISVVKSFKWRRLALLWLQTVFWGLVCVAAFKILAPYIGIKVSSRHFGDALKPIICETYWYFSAYAGMFALMPFMNAAMNSMSVKSLRNAVFAMVVMFSVVPTVAGKDVFGTALGFSVWWLSFMYIIGGYARLGGLAEKVSARTAATVALVAWLVSAGLALAMFKHKQVFLNYISINILLLSVSFLVLFAKVKNVNTVLCWIARLAPYTFGVYLIHEHPFVKGQLRNRFLWIYSLDPVTSVLCAVAVSAAIFLVCAGLDFVRSRIFAAIKVRELVDNASERLARKLGDVDAA